MKTFREYLAEAKINKQKGIKVSIEVPSQNPTNLRIYLNGGTPWEFEVSKEFGNKILELEKSDDYEIINDKYGSEIAENVTKFIEKEITNLEKKLKNS